MRTSADSWQPKGASLESCCSASSAHDTTRTEPQRLELLACLATSNFKRSLGMGGACQTPLAALLRTCERLQIAGRQKGLAWKALAQTHLPMALLAQSHKHWRCLLVLPPQTSNVAWEWGGCLPDSTCSPARKMRTSVDSWQPEGASLESCCSAPSAHGTARTEPQRLALLACLDTSNFERSLGMGGCLPGSFQSSAPKIGMSADRWQPEGASLESSCSASSAHDTARTEPQRLGLLACLATSNLKRSLGMGGCLPDSTCSPAPNMRTSANRWQPEGASLERCCSASSAHGTARIEAQTLELLACLATTNFKLSLGMGGCLPDSPCSPAPKMRTSADRWQPEGATLGSSCSASSAHDTARTEPQRLELLASLAISNFKRSLGMGADCQTLLAALLRRCERLQIAGRQKGLAWKYVAQPHLPMSLLTQSHRHWGCLLVLPPQTSNVAWEW